MIVRVSWLGCLLTIAAIALAVLAIGLSAKAVAACESVDVTPNTPTGIAGCERSGEGIASHYGPGTGVAMNFCTWELRHGTGCGHVTIQSHQTGITVTAPVVDFCDCYTNTPDERIVDLQLGVVDALGLDRADGLYPVTVWREGASSHTYLPNTAIDSPRGGEYSPGVPAGAGDADGPLPSLLPPGTDGARQRAHPTGRFLI